MKRNLIQHTSSSSSDSFNSDTDSSLPSKVSHPRLVERNTQPNGVSLVNHKRSGKVEPQDIVALAKEIKDANAIISAVTCGKLKLISDQIKRLQEEAMEIIEEGLQNLDLHKVSCNFIKIPGAVYHLYQRDSGQKYFSMLSPKDWNSTPPHPYLGSYKLNYDRSWAEINDSNEISPTTNYFMQEFSSISQNKSSDDSMLSETEMDADSSDFQMSVINTTYHPKSSSNSRKASRIMKNVLRTRDYV